MSGSLLETHPPSSGAHMEEAGCTDGASVTACSLFPQQPDGDASRSPPPPPPVRTPPPPFFRFGTAFLGSHCCLISRTAALDNGESDIPWTGLSEAARTPTILATDAQKASPGYCQGGDWHGKTRGTQRLAQVYRQ